MKALKTTRYYFLYSVFLRERERERERERVENAHYLQKEYIKGTRLMVSQGILTRFKYINWSFMVLWLRIINRILWNHHSSLGNNVRRFRGLS